MPDRDSNKAPKIKSCPRCRKNFQCYESKIESCPCFNIILSKEASGRIKSKYGDCLCFECLKAEKHELK
ncbi:MAG: cysteine-rich CWC family protein [Bacteroidetes bacterium]|nr:cysteine-rich CWC family protein [Bacteroidota bacterium]